MTDATPKVFEIYIRAPAQAVWDAITSPDWNGRYGYKAPSEYDLKPGGAFVARSNAQMRAYGMAEVIIDGEVLEVDAPHRLVQTYRFLFSPETTAEGFNRLTWEVVPTSQDFVRVTLTHDLNASPVTAGMVTSKFSDQGGGGWNWILSDMKSLLETGTNL